MNRETFILIGGTAALLLQVAHPLVAAGVDQHSDFRRSPHRRLLRTVDATQAIVYGDSAMAWDAIASINRRHLAIRGVAADGRAYDAKDPALLLWVQCTLVLTSLRLYELVMGRLPRSDRQAYWTETKSLVSGLGLASHRVPASIEDLEAYERAMLSSIVIPDRTSRAVARDVLRPYSALPEIAFWPNDVATAGLLPRAIREAFGLPFGVRERLAFRSLVVALRMFVPALPPFVRYTPQSRRWGAR